MFGYLWISKREWARHQRELNAALKRALDAEQRLEQERTTKDATILELTSRFLTKQGSYGLTVADKAQSPTAKTEQPNKFIREPTAEDEARLNYYKQCYKEAGRSEEEAEQIWEQEMRGEQPRYPYEESELEQ